MSKKLLKESTVRRFMTLANIAPLTNAFLNEDLPTPEEEPERRAPSGDQPSREVEDPPPPLQPPPPPPPETQKPQSMLANRDEEDFEGDVEEESELDISSDDSDKLANIIANALNDALPGITMHVEAEEGEPDMELKDLEGLTGEQAFGAGMAMGEEEPEELEEKHRRDRPDRVAGRKAGGRRVVPEGLEEAVRDAIFAVLREEEEKGEKKEGGKKKKKKGLTPEQKAAAESDMPLIPITPPKKQDVEEAVEGVDLIDDERLAENIYHKIMSRYGRKK